MRKGGAIMRPGINEGDSQNEELLSTLLGENIEKLKSKFLHTPDLILRYLEIHGKALYLTYLGSLVDNNVINNNILRSLQAEKHEFKTIWDIEISVSEKKYSRNWKEIENAILLGKSVLFLDGEPYALIINTQGWPQRDVTEPQIESSLKGAHQGFIETATKNIGLIRRYLPNKELKIKEMIVGQRGKTSVSILYLEDVVNLGFIEEMVDRIQKIKTDAVINSGELMQLIEDNPFSPFPQFLMTERPDVAVKNLLYGRIVVVVDRSPSVIVGPATFISFFQTIDDYATRWIIATFLRLIRTVAFFVAIFLPSLYIAALSFHYEIIPLNLIMTIGESREKVPLPPIVEAILMEIAIEMLREAGLRLPSPIGQTVGVVGGVVIGQAAVQAGIVSNIMVVIVALTAIASFIIPNPDMSEAIRILRFPIMVIASLFGLVGIVIGLMIIVIHLVSLESLKTPFGSPFSPVRFRDWKDTVIRFPLWNMTKRPASARPTQSQRQEKFRK